MKSFSGSPSKCVIGFWALILAFVTIQGLPMGFGGPGGVEAKISQEMVPFDGNHPVIRALMAVQHRHGRRLMAIPEVVGTAIGLDEAGRVALLVFTKEEVTPGLVPESLEGMPVIKTMTGEIRPMKGLSPTSAFPRPVPIGVSTGNEKECSAGTIAARVKDGAGNVYALSNNHVFALENNASLGSKILQPGTYDTSCTDIPTDMIGTLTQFVPLDFSSSGSNTVDAAIALSSKDLLGNGTPRKGYGIPRSTPGVASVGLAVKKYGRTTLLTKGTVAAINATINVQYDSGTARFVNQIGIESSKAFMKPGDSGSLLVTKSGSNPVGLLFAGNSTGKFAFANPIEAVLEAFGVTIDGN